MQTACPFGFRTKQIETEWGRLADTAAGDVLAKIIFVIAAGPFRKEKPRSEIFFLVNGLKYVF